MYMQEEPCASQLQRGFFYLDRDPFLAYREDALNSISWDDSTFLYSLRIELGARMYQHLLFRLDSVLSTVDPYCDRLRAIQFPATKKGDSIVLKRKHTHTHTRALRWFHYLLGRNLLWWTLIWAKQPFVGLYLFAPLCFVVYCGDLRLHGRYWMT